MASVHVVEFGEHLAAIALDNGFENFTPIWEHPQNASLREQRKDPLQLVAGDVVMIPDLNPRVFSRPTANQHSFSVKIDRIALHLQLLTLGGKPRATLPVKIGTPAKQFEDATNGEGKIEVEIDKRTRVASVSFKNEPPPKAGATGGSSGSGGSSKSGAADAGDDDDPPPPPPPDHIEFSLRVGALYPITEELGWVQRLTNLGYFVAPPPRDDDELRSSIEEFQCDHDIKPITGERDAATEAKLLEIHGS